MFVRLRRFWVSRTLFERVFAKALLVLIVLSGAALFFFPEYKNYIYLIFLSVPTNSIIPFPHEPVILSYAKIMQPLAVTVFACIGVGISAVIDHFVVSKGSNTKTFAPFKEKKYFKKTVYYFNKFPFFTVIFFATGFIPALSMMFIRLLAPASGYPSYKYVTAVIIGRFIRFIILATFGYMVKLPNWLIAVIGIAIFVGMIWYPAKKFIKRHFGKKNSETCL